MLKSIPDHQWQGRKESISICTGSDVSLLPPTQSSFPSHTPFQTDFHSRLPKLFSHKREFGPRFLLIDCFFNCDCFFYMLTGLQQMRLMGSSSFGKKCFDSFGWIRQKQSIRKCLNIVLFDVIVFAGCNVTCPAGLAPAPLWAECRLAEISKALL